MTVNKKDKATPIPWDVQNKGSVTGPSGRHEIVAGVNVDGEKNLPRICKMPDLSDRSYANAAHIVRCVNSHADLLAACKALVACIHVHGLREPNASSMKILDNAGNAIAKAQD